MSDNTQTTNGRVIELVLFKLKADTTEADFLRDNAQTFPFLERLDGYIDRELSKNEDGLWADYVHWRDMDSAMTAAEIFMSDPVGQQMGRHIDESTLQMFHLVSVAQGEKSAV